VKIVGASSDFLPAVHLLELIMTTRQLFVESEKLYHLVIVLHFGGTTSPLR